MSIFLNLLHVFWNIVNLFYILFSRSVSVNVNVDKDITHTVRLQSNTTSLEFVDDISSYFFVLTGLV